jgi:hypothetical protein
MIRKTAFIAMQVRADARVGAGECLLSCVGYKALCRRLCLVFANWYTQDTMIRKTGFIAI